MAPPLAAALRGSRHHAHPRTRGPPPPSVADSSRRRHRSSSSSAGLHHAAAGQHPAGQQQQHRLLARAASNVLRFKTDAALPADLAAKMIPDRVHPGPAGHLLMAAALLKSWNAPATVTR